MQKRTIKSVLTLVLFGIAMSAHAASYSFTKLGTLGGPSGLAFAINNAGQVAGYSYTSNAKTHATLWNGNTTTDLGTLIGGNNSYASAINNAGQVAGSAYFLGYTATHATLWNGKTVTDLGTLGGEQSYAYAINNVGQLVGSAFTKNNQAHATLWDGGVVIDLNSFLDASTVNAGWVLVDARDINDNGWIVGNASNSRLGIYSPFLLVPVPEPETYGMMLMGLSLLGFMVRRGKKS